MTDASNNKRRKSESELLSEAEDIIEGISALISFDPEKHKVPNKLMTYVDIHYVHMWYCCGCMQLTLSRFPT